MYCSFSGFWKHVRWIIRKILGSSHPGSVVTKPTSIHEDVDLTPGLAQWVKDPVLLWLWCRPAAAAAAPSLGTSICR